MSNTCTRNDTTRQLSSLISINLIDSRLTRSRGLLRLNKYLFDHNYLHPNLHHHPSCLILRRVKCSSEWKSRKYHLRGNGMATSPKKELFRSWVRHCLDEFRLSVFLRLLEKTISYMDPPESTAFNIANHFAMAIPLMPCSISNAWKMVNKRIPERKVFFLH